MVRCPPTSDQKPNRSRQRIITNFNRSFSNLGSDSAIAIGAWIKAAQDLQDYEDDHPQPKTSTPNLRVQAATIQRAQTTREINNYKQTMTAGIDAMGGMDVFLDALYQQDYRSRAGERPNAITIRAALSPSGSLNHTLHQFAMNAFEAHNQSCPQEARVDVQAIKEAYAQTPESHRKPRTAALTIRRNAETSESVGR